MDKMEFFSIEDSLPAVIVGNYSISYNFFGMPYNEVFSDDVTATNRFKELIKDSHVNDVQLGFTQKTEDVAPSLSDTKEQKLLELCKLWNLSREDMLKAQALCTEAIGLQDAFRFVESTKPLEEAFRILMKMKESESFEDRVIDLIVKADNIEQGRIYRSIKVSIRPNYDEGLNQRELKYGAHNLHHLAFDGPLQR